MKDCKQSILRGCVLKGECALEVRKNSKVRLENCILIASAGKVFKEDNVTG